MVNGRSGLPRRDGPWPATPDATEGSFWSIQTMHGTALWLWVSEEVRRFPNPGHGETCPNWSEQMLPYTFLLFLLEAATAIHKPFFSFGSRLKFGSSHAPHDVSLSQAQGPGLRLEVQVCARLQSHPGLQGTPALLFIGRWLLLQQDQKSPHVFPSACDRPECLRC